jgi:hypothetical protein
MDLSSRIQEYYRRTLSTLFKDVVHGSRTKRTVGKKENERKYVLTEYMDCEVDHKYIHGL